MIIWKYTSESGEELQFCCELLKRFYSRNIAWDEGTKKYCLSLWRPTKQDNAGIIQEGIVPGVRDLIPISNCPFCGSGIYQ
jgi:hypothetical protein